MEFNDKQAIYEQIADHFCELILKKKMKEGEKIPSIRDTAVKLEVNPNTVFRTYNFMQDTGIIFNKRGIGYFVAENAYQKTLEYKKETFVEEELPKIFQTMDMLNMNTNDLQEQYNVYKNQTV